MSVRNPNYQQVHDLYELCSDGRSLQEFCRMSGVSYQKYLEWERNFLPCYYQAHELPRMNALEVAKLLSTAA